MKNYIIKPDRKHKEYTKIEAYEKASELIRSFGGSYTIYKTHMVISEDENKNIVYEKKD